MGCFYNLPFLILILAIISSSDLFLTVHPTTHPSDIQALKDLLKGLDPNSIPQASCLSSWDFSTDPCSTIFTQRFTCGFRCDLNDSGLARVTELTLDPAGYSGPLSLSPLPFLQTLDLSNNQFNGPIPSSISNLSRLSQLILSHNSFSGQIPPSIFTSSLSNLQTISLDNNLLHGPIPPTITALSSLLRLELQSNNLSGEIPDLSDLKNLSFFDASDNLLSGSMNPVRFPVQIIQISVRNNGLEGGILRGIGDLGFLQVMDMSHNRLSGEVPAAIFEHPALEQVTLSENRFTVIGIPESCGRKSELIALDLGGNEIEGLLPEFLGLMPRLSALSLERNRFTGMIPAQYAVKTVVPEEGTEGFQRLVLSGNYLFGPIPGPLLGMKPGSAIVSLVDNCLVRCPESFFFCQGGQQKSLDTCRTFSPVIP